jgi:TPR repeat protein
MAMRPPKPSAAARALWRVVVGCALAAVVAFQISAPDARPQQRRWQAEDAACRERADPDISAARAREALNLGDAEIASAEPRLEIATMHWQRAIEEGSCTGAQAAVVARKRLQMWTLTAWSTPESLDALKNQLNGPIVDVRILQRALWALGYYKAGPDGQLTPQTRAALHKFQNDMAFDEIDAIVPRQVVYLIGNAAETARDAASQRTLAFMFVAGIGVPENMEFAAAWLRKASSRDHAESTFYLAVLNGAVHYVDDNATPKEPMCFSKNLAYADQYLREAARQGHHDAQELLRKYKPGADGHYPWNRMKDDSIVINALRVFGDKCQPYRPQAAKAASRTAALPLAAAVSHPPLPIAKPQ